MAMPAGPVRIAFPEEAATVASLLKDALSAEGIDVPAAPPAAAATEIRLVLTGPGEIGAMDADGFEKQLSTVCSAQA